MFYVHILNKQGEFDVIDGDFLSLYPDLSDSDLIALSDKQYAEWCEKGNRETRFVAGQFVFNVAEVDVQAVKNAERFAIRTQINTKRDECVDGGVYVPAIDKWVDTDEKGRATLVEIKADFDLNGRDNAYTLICADNTAKTINFDEFKAVWDAVKTLKEKMFENAYMHKVLLENSDNPADYDWSIGWSKTYQQHLAEVGNE